MISDKAFEMSPTKKRLIHGHMKHQERTADANYVLRVNAERASRAHELMQDIIHDTDTSTPAAPSPAVAPSPVEAQKEQEENEEGSNEDVSLASLSKHQPKSSEDEDDEPLVSLTKKRKRNVLESSDDESGPQSPRGSVVSLGDEHKSVLLTVFSQEISTGKLLTMHEVRNKMRAHIFLRKMVVQADFVKKVADFVRYKTNHTCQLQLTQLSDLDVEDGVISLSIESGVRKVWSAHDATVIEEKFKSHPKFPGKKEILNQFSTDEVLSHILEREGAVRCYEKVKSLFKQRNQ